MLTRGFATNAPMKALLAITTVVFISVASLNAGEEKKSAKSGEPCPSAKTECSSKKECPKAAAALRQTLLTHKGSSLARR